MKNSSRTKKAFINTAMGIFNRFSNTIFSFALRTVFIYTLGIQYTGVSSVFTDILTMLSLSELGISTAIATALYKPLHEKDDKKIQKLMNFYKLAYRYIAIFIFCAGILLLPFLDNLITDVPDIKENIKVIFLLYITKTSASYLLIYKTTILDADQKQYIIKWYETGCTFFKYLIEIALLIIFKNFMLYLLLEVVLTITQNIIITKRAKNEYPNIFKKNNEKLEKGEIKKLFGDIKALSMYRISGSIGNSIDNILVSSFLGTSMVGILSNYTLIRKQLENIILQFFYSITPSLGNLVAEGNTEKQISIFNKVFYISFLIVNFCAVTMFIVFTPFIKFWIGDEYLLSYAISFVISFDFFLYVLLQAIASFRTANGLFVKGQYRPLITAILNIILSIILIRKMGIFGTILSTIICRLATQWYDPYILFKNVFKLSFRKFYSKYLKYIIIFISGSIISYSISSIINTNYEIINILINLLIGITVPNVIAILFTFRTEEFKNLVELVNKKLIKKLRRKNK